MDCKLIQGDSLTVLRTLPSNSVHCCVTSPPYFGLRAYLPADHPDKALEIGTEDTPDAYVARLVEVFREVRRVLHPTGVVFLNLGDSYNGSGTMGSMDSKQGTNVGSHAKTATHVAGLKPKDLLGIPWLVAFALRADGWYLRSEIIWHKRAPMPESVTDRPTKAHEQVFLLAKNATYYYDAEAIKEPFADERMGNPGPNVPVKKLALARDLSGFASGDGQWNANGQYTGRNKRSVWTLGPEPSHLAHYATMPTKLVEPCILAGTSQYGACEKCLAPWERVVEHGEPTKQTTRGQQPWTKVTGQRDSAGGLPMRPRVTVDWQPTCTCNAAVIPCTVLDPFSGSGTTLAVALKFGRRAIGIDLDERNLEMARNRIERMQPMLLEATA